MSYITYAHRRSKFLYNAISHVLPRATYILHVSIPLYKKCKYCHPGIVQPQMMYVPGACNILITYCVNLSNMCTEFVVYICNYLRLCMLYMFVYVLINTVLLRKCIHSIFFTRTVYLPGCTQYVILLRMPRQ